MKQRWGSTVVMVTVSGDVRYGHGPAGFAARSRLCSKGLAGGHV